MTDTQNPEVGYGRPPVAHQFQKGTSGNPAGRPEGSRSISSAIAAAMAEKVVVNINGKKRRITKLQAAFTQLANKAAGGDRHAAKLIIDLFHQSETRDEARAAGTPIGAEDRRATDAAILEALRANMRNTLPEDNHDQPV
jgi:hypothetical protein